MDCIIIPLKSQKKIITLEDQLSKYTHISTLNNHFSTSIIPVLFVVDIYKFHDVLRLIVSS